MSLNAQLKKLKPRSLGKRLAVTSAISLVLILLCFAFLINYLLSQMLTTAAEQFVRNEIAVIQRIYQQAQNPIADLRGELRYDQEFFDNKKNNYFMYYGSVTVDGKLLVATRLMYHIFDPSDFVMSHDIDHLILKHWRSSKGQQYKLVAYQPAGKNYVIRLALDYTNADNIRSLMVELSIISVAIAAGFAAILLFVLVKLNTRSIKQLTAKLKQVNIQHLSLDIDDQHLPQEVYELVVQFRAMLRSIEVAYQRLLDFSSELSHEIRTPLQILIGQTDVALSHEPDTKEYHAVLQSNYEELQRLHALIENLILFSRSDNQQLAVALEEIHLRPMLMGLVDALMKIDDSHRFELDVANDAHVIADPLLLRRALLNLLTNAVRYSAAGSRIVVRARMCGNQTVIEVQDEGVGIPLSAQDEIFTRFHRIREQGERRLTEQGMGLGLSIVKMIMDLHHGSVTISSEPGVGSTFTLTFQYLE